MNAVITQNPLIEKLAKQTEKNKNSFPVLRSYLDFAWNTFLKYGFPTTKHEEWKYFSLKKILPENLALTTSKLPDENKIREILKNLPQGNYLVFFNGKFQKSLSVLESSLIVEDFQNLSQEKISTLGDFLLIDTRPVEALNAAAFTSGTYLEVQGKTEKPIYFLHFFDAEADLLLQPRFFIKIPENLQVEFYEQVFSLGENNIVINSVTEAILGDFSELLWERLYDFPENISLINTTVIKQERSSKSKNTIIATQEGRLRNNYEVLLNGEDAYAELFGFSDGKKQNLTDHHTAVSHIVENCKSFQLYKGIAKEQSTIVFNGKIYVFPEAQKTDAFQENHHKLLSYDANVFTKPQLEILADDVKCSHGATIGKIDENQLFYLKSRGIPEELSRQILLNAFASEIFNTLKNDYFRQRISETFIL